MIITFVRRCSFACIALTLSAGLFAADSIGPDEQAFIIKNLTQEERSTFQQTMGSYQHTDQRLSYAEGRIQAGLQAVKPLQVARGVAMTPAAPVVAAGSTVPVTPMSEAEQAFITENMNDSERDAAANAMRAYMRDHGRDDMAALQQAGMLAARKLQVARGIDVNGSELTADPNTLPNMQLSDAEIEFIGDNSTNEEKELGKNVILRQMKANVDRDIAIQQGKLAVKKRQIARGVIMPGASRNTVPAASQQVQVPPLANAETVAQVAAFKAEVAKLDAVDAAYKKSLFDAVIIANDQYMRFIATLDLRDLSDAIPADPKRSDLIRRDKVQSFNAGMPVVREKLAEWKAQQTDPKRREMGLKTLMTLAELPTDSHGFFPQFGYDLYIELKLQAQVPVAVPVDQPGPIDTAPWRQKK